MEFTDPNSWLPLVFASLMALAMLIYALLDGYDLGVGVLMFAAPPQHRDMMIASIGPFWDANETWLVLGVGLLLVAFPIAHGIILTALYLPVVFMLAGLILRGTAFDFRAKVHSARKDVWDLAFRLGSLIASLGQGYMLGAYILGFELSLAAFGFALLIGLCLTAGYAFIGAAWLIMKTEGELQRHAVAWARKSLYLMVAGIGVVSLATPLVSPRIFEKWFVFPEIIFLAPIPLLTGAIIVVLHLVLRRLPLENDEWCWVPFVGAAAVYVLCFAGLAYSFFPFIVPDKLTIWQAASASDSLMVILVGVLIVLPAILAYTAFAYRVFWGKAKNLSYS